VKLRTVSALGIEAARDAPKEKLAPKRRAARLENEHESTSFQSSAPAMLQALRFLHLATRPSNALEIGKPTLI
jgi:hypothetical protein